MKHRTAIGVLVLLGSVVVLATSASARVKLTFSQTDPGRYQAKPLGCDIEVFLDARPQRPYVEIGIVNFHDERHRSNAKSLKLDVALPKINARACQAGGDALIDVSVTDVRRLEFVMFNVRASVVRFGPKP